MKKAITPPNHAPPLSGQSLPPPPASGNHRSVFRPYRFVFSRMSYKCNHILCGFFGLASFIQDNTFERHPSCCVLQSFIPFPCQVLFYGVGVPQCVNPLPLSVGGNNKAFLALPDGEMSVKAWRKASTTILPRRQQGLPNGYQQRLSGEPRLPLTSSPARAVAKEASYHRRVTKPRLAYYNAQSIQVATKNHLSYHEPRRPQTK